MSVSNQLAINKLPVELRQQIFVLLPRHTLTCLCLASSTILSVTRPVLYRELILKDGYITGDTFESIHLELGETLDLLLKEPVLAACVNSLDIPNDLNIPPSWTPDIAIPRLSTILKSMINLKHVGITQGVFSCWHLPSGQIVDEAVVEALNEVGLKSLKLNLIRDREEGDTFPS
jgi:hypothetical protein